MVRFKNPIPGHENDHIIIFARRHFISMLSTLVLNLMMILAPILIYIGVHVTTPSIFSGIFLNFLVIIGSIYYLVSATVIFTIWVGYYYNVFIVTDDAIIDVGQNGIFDRRITEISLLRIQDVSARIKGFLPSLFNYGNVVAESAGENSRTYVIDNVSNPVAIAEKILELHNEHIAKEERVGEVVTGDGDLRGGVIVKSSPNSENQSTNLPSNNNSDQIKVNEDSVFASKSPLENSLGDSEKSECVCPPLKVESNDEQAQPSQGDINKDDLEKGGEVKF
jgi:hypothetical protein